MGEEEETSLEQTGKRVGKHIAQRMARITIRQSVRLSKHLFKALFLSKAGLIIVVASLLILLIVASLSAMFESVSAGDLCDSGEEGGVNDLIRSQYEEATDRHNPPIISENAEENKYLLTWGTVYAVDYLSYESEIDLLNDNKTLCERLAYNNLDILTKKLIPKFTYGNYTNTIKTTTKVPVEDEEGNITGYEEVTNTETYDVKLLETADTIDGFYTYSYEYETVEWSSDDTKIEIRSAMIIDIDFVEDYTRFIEVLKEYLKMKEVSNDDREFVMRLGKSADTGFNHMYFMLGGEYGSFPGLLDGVNLFNLPPEWIQAFKDAGKRYNIDPAVLMAIAYVESSFNPNAVGFPNYSGELARGLMQFLPSTFEWIGVDGDGDGKKDIFNPIDSIFSAARYLDYLNFNGNPKKALARYSGGAKNYYEKVFSLVSRMEIVLKGGGGGGVYMWPVPTHFYISSHFGPRIAPTKGASTFHNGIDIPAPVGTPIVATADGVVIASGPARGYGGWIVIQHANNTISIYGHMYLKDLFVKVGDHVKMGQIISLVGNNGTSTGAHLHFQIEVGGNPFGGKAVNPLHYVSPPFR